MGKFKEEVVRRVNLVREVIKVCEGRKTSALQGISAAHNLLVVHVWIETRRRLAEGVPGYSSAAFLHRTDCS